VKLDSVRTVFQALDAAGVRFLVAGGLAVNVYGVHRFTKDIDLVIDLELPGTRPVLFVSRDTLIAMKLKAGRSRDLADIEDLRLLEGP
jgi:predicted nucleotidyltransferase